LDLIYIEGEDFLGIVFGFMHFPSSTGSADIFPPAIDLFLLN